MENDWTKLIERYLNNELSAEGKLAFEQELATNAALKAEFELQQLTHTIIARTATRSLVQSAAKAHHWNKTLKTIGISLLAVAAIATLAFYFTQKSKHSEETNKSKIEQALLTKTELTAEEFSHLDTITYDKEIIGKGSVVEKAYIPFIQQFEKDKKFSNLPAQYFQSCGEPDAYLTDEGVLLSITKNSFTLNGKPYNGPAVVQFQEAITPTQLAKAGLSTMADGKLLETQGMFSLNAYTPEGKKLTLSDQGAYVQVPVDEYKTRMKLFEGVAQENGDVNWVKPEELERVPILKPMAQIDFYPTGFPQKLDELQWTKAKQQRDSLYLSFEFENGQTVTSEVVSDTIAYKLPIEIPTKSKNRSKKEEDVKFKSTIDYLGNNEALLTVYGYLKDGWYFLTPSDVKNFITSFENPIFQISPQKGLHTVGDLIDNNPKVDLIEFSGIEKYAVFQQKIKYDKNIKSVKFGFNYILASRKSIYPPTSKIFELFINQPQQSITTKQILPSSVLAFWKPQFDSTNLGTVEFEERMRAIHATCDPKLVELYRNNLQEKLWVLDERAVKMGYTQFQKFAEERVGKIDISDEHQQNVQAFYDSSLKTIQAMGKENFEKEINRRKKHDQEVHTARQQEVIRKGIRESENLNEEFEFNMEHVYKQLGKKRPKVGFTMSRGRGIANIDRYVMEATMARKSTTITDPVTGKTAEIKYKELKITVNESAAFNKLYLYLFSKEMDSYQRIDIPNGQLTYSLNEDMNYTAAIVGVNEGGFHILEMQKPFDYQNKQINLTPVSEQEFEQTVQRLNKERKATVRSISDEVAWLFTEQKDYVEQKKRKDDAEFRNVLRPIVFPCRRVEMSELTNVESFK